MPHVILCQGTALALPLKDASVHTVCTSPPYLALRSYGIGAAHGELGLEESVEAYVAAMVQVFREVKRVLRPDGTLWLNMGDSYNAHPGQRSSTDKAGPKQQTNNGSVAIGSRHVERFLAKNLLGMPWRLAFALQQDGWILRSDIIWDKPSCMPESVQDRPTRSHEYIFLFSKQAHYHYDAHAIREPATMRPQRHLTQQPRREGRYGIDAWTKPRLLRDTPGIDSHPDGRNARTVWRIASEATPFAHFATFPQALVRRCLLAGAPSAVCNAPIPKLQLKRDLPPEAHEKIAKFFAKKGLAYEHGTSEHG